MEQFVFELHCQFWCRNKLHNYIVVICLLSVGRGHFLSIHLQSLVATPLPYDSGVGGAIMRLCLQATKTDDCYSCWAGRHAPATTSLTDAPGNDTKQSLLALSPIASVSEQRRRRRPVYREWRLVTRSTGRAIAVQLKQIGFKLRDEVVRTTVIRLLRRVGSNPARNVERISDV